jgi:hypothetical protein
MNTVQLVMNLVVSYLVKVTGVYSVFSKVWMTFQMDLMLRLCGYDTITKTLCLNRTGNS